jgi:hypothetical protein
LKRIPIPVLVSLTLIGVIAVTAAAAAALRSRVPDPRVPSERTAAFQSKAVRGTVHLLVDLAGWWSEGPDRFASIPPVRVFDTRRPGGARLARFVAPAVRVGRVEAAAPRVVLLAR